MRRISGEIHVLQQLSMDIALLWVCSRCVCGLSLKCVEILCPYIKVRMRLSVYI